MGKVKVTPTVAQLPGGEAEKELIQRQVTQSQRHSKKSIIRMQKKQLKKDFWTLAKVGFSIAAPALGA